MDTKHPSSNFAVIVQEKRGLTAGSFKFKPRYVLEEPHTKLDDDRNILYSTSIGDWIIDLQL